MEEKSFIQASEAEALNTETESDNSKKEKAEQIQGSETDLFNMNERPLNDARKKLLEKGLKGLSLKEQILFRDNVLVGEIAPGINIKPDHAYRAINEATLKKYIEDGGVEVDKHEDVYVPGEGNAGVDWFLGGVAFKYGSVAIEAPAQKKFFSLTKTSEEGGGLAAHPYVSHIKTRGGDGAIPIEEITMVLREKVGPNGEKIYEKSSIKEEKEKIDEGKISELRKKIGIEVEKTD